MTFMKFQQELEELAKKKVIVRINDNRSTMLSVKWEPHCTKVSLHRIFLDAPKNVMDELACHIRKKNSSATVTIKAYIEDKLRNLDYSGKVDKQKLVTKGKFYDFQAIYNHLNSAYFQESLDLLITWFGRTKVKNRSSLTFGLYHEPLKLIKIHRMMDSNYFPDYFVEFVIYHEMLHNVCPSFYDKKGRHNVHTKEFKRLEKRYRHYKEATAWLKKNTYYLFSA